MKNLIFTIIVLTITYLLLEVLGYAAYRVKFGNYQVHDLQLSKSAAIQAAQDSGVFIPENARQDNVITKPILHPYVGFTVDGHRRKANCKSEDFKECYSRIKVDADRPFAKRTENRLIIGILGGSFADGTARGGNDGIIAQSFRALPLFANKSEIVIYNMAAGAYKQPQQLMQAAYYMALGAEFDILINLDGFNEIAGSFYGWRDSQLHPAFPKSWNHRVSSSLSKDYLVAFAQKHSLTNSRSRFAKLTSKFPLRWSPTINFIWQLSDNRDRRLIGSYNTEIAELTKVDPAQRDFALEALGPDYDLQSFSDLASYSAKLWSDSSQSLRALAEGSGTRYYHFLQPNQYIEGAKTLSEEEKKTAILETGGYGNVYKKGYSYIVKQAGLLKGNGVNYHDLTHIFKDNSHTLYIDNCCHLNRKGYDLVVKKIATTIGENWYEL